MQNVNQVRNPTPNFIRNFAILVTDLFKLFCAVIVFVFTRIIEEILAIEHIFILMTNLYAFFCQFFFFTLCDLALLEEEFKEKRGKVVSGLTTILLYSIFTYFASKIREIFRVNMDRTMSRNGNFALKIAKILLEFAKAAIVVLCLREQGLQYRFDFFYSTATFVYYVFSEKIFVELAISSTKLCNFQKFDSLEQLYVPIFLQIVNLSLTVLTILLTFRKHPFYILLTAYFTLYLPVKNLFCNFLRPLALEKRTFRSFKEAAEEELEAWNDICAVCLERMSKARITPCRHFFHPTCLKRCLRVSMQCPLCKADFV